MKKNIYIFIYILSKILSPVAEKVKKKNMDMFLGVSSSWKLRGKKIRKKTKKKNAAEIWMGY